MHRSGWWTALFLLAALFAALGDRPLNEPDEGRYAGIGAAMADSGDYIVPRFWGLPHLDKPPLTYWLLALSLKTFGRSDWAARLPLALASGAAAAAVWLLGRRAAGEPAARRAAVIFATALLPAAMGRMITADAMLTASVCWTALAGWRLVEPTPPGGGPAGWGRWGWAALGTVSLAAGLLAKGPVAAIIPLGPCLAVAWGAGARRWPSIGWLGGLFLAGALASLPWFLRVEAREPGALHYQVFGMALGHALGTTIQNRPGGMFYYAPIVLLGLTPWTVWAGGVLQPDWWRRLPVQHRRTAWFLVGWAGLVFLLFTGMRAKLPAYVLPLFPPVAILTAWRWFGADGRRLPGPGERSPVLLALVGFPAAPAALAAVFHAPTMAWLGMAGAGAGALGVAALVLARRGWWTRDRTATAAAGLAVMNVAVICLAAPLYDTWVKGNQTLAPLAQALNAAARPGDRLVAWGRLPQGLPYSAQAAFTLTAPPWLGGMPTNRPPFEYPGNLGRLGDHWLPDAAALARFLEPGHSTLVVAFEHSLPARLTAPSGPLHLLSRSGQWELWTDR